MKVGGMFCLEKPGDTISRFPQALDEYISRAGDYRFCMSGRCGIYYSLLDILQHDTKRTAYLPAYTCETVIDSYVKAGYQIIWYDVSPDLLTPRFDPGAVRDISVLGLCGYFGFSYYDRNFVKACRDAGVTIVHDITHSAFSGDGVDPLAHYAAGSFRKWIGIPSGGIAVKQTGTFNLPMLPAEEEHIRGRVACFEAREKVLEQEDGVTDDIVTDIFWKTELRLRKMFDAYESDELSGEIMTHYDYAGMIEKRRGNYQYILSDNPFNEKIRPVFPVLRPGECPSHMSLYSPDRGKIQEILLGEGIKSTVYWPEPPHVDLSKYPGAAKIYKEIFSLPVDQRYGEEEMAVLCNAIRKAGS